MLKAARQLKADREALRKALDRNQRARESATEEDRKRFDAHRGRLRQRLNNVEKVVRHFNSRVSPMDQI